MTTATASSPGRGSAGGVRHLAVSVVHAAGRRPGVEAVLAFAVSLVLACLSHVHTVLHLSSTVPEDVGDPLLQAWMLAWDGHVATDPGNVFDANILYPLDNTLGFSDSLFGLFPFGLVGHGQTAALVRYNVVFLLMWALCGAAAYLLARQLGARRGGAVVAGAVFGWAPWRVPQSGHLQILSSGFIVLALALLARGHGITWSSSGLRVFRPKAVVGGWAFAAWQVSLGFGVGLQSSYLLAGLSVVVVGWVLVTGRWRTVPGAVWVADLIGVGIFLLMAGIFAQPYLKAVADHPEARRSLGDLDYFSPPWYGFLTPPERSGLLGGTHLVELRGKLQFSAETAFDLGWCAVVLAVVGVVWGGGGLRGWSLRRRLSVAGLTLFLLVLACGTTLGGSHSPYALLLFDTLPGWQGVRTPGRLGVTATIGLALLAGLGAEAAGRAFSRWVGAAAEAGTDVAAAEAGTDVAAAEAGTDVAAAEAGTGVVARPQAAWAVAAVLAVLVLAEGWNTTPAVAPRPPLVAMTMPAGPTLVLPSDDLGDDEVMLWTTATFTPVVNGSSGFVPTQTTELRAATQDFPSVASIQALQAVNVRRVVIDVERARGTALGQRAEMDWSSLGLTRTDYGDSVVFTLP